MAWGGALVVLWHEHALRGRAARACVDKHGLHKRRRGFGAVVGADTRARPRGPEHIAHALGEVPGVYGVSHYFAGRRGRRVVDDELLRLLLVHADAYLAPVDGLFEPTHRVYRRRREVGFVRELRDDRESTAVSRFFCSEIGSAEFVTRIYILLKEVRMWSPSSDLATRNRCSLFELVPYLSRLYLCAPLV